LREFRTRCRNAGLPRRLCFRRQRGAQRGGPDPFDGSHRAVFWRCPYHRRNHTASASRQIIVATTEKRVRSDWDVTSRLLYHLSVTSDLIGIREEMMFQETCGMTLAEW